MLQILESGQWALQLTFAQSRQTQPQRFCSLTPNLFLWLFYPFFQHYVPVIQFSPLIFQHSLSIFMQFLPILDHSLLIFQQSLSIFQQFLPIFQHSLLVFQHSLPIFLCCFQTLFELLLLLIAKYMFFLSVFLSIQHWNCHRSY